MPKIGRVLEVSGDTPVLCSVVDGSGKLPLEAMVLWEVSELCDDSGSVASDTQLPAQSAKCNPNPSTDDLLGQAAAKATDGDLGEAAW